MKKYAEIRSGFVSNICSFPESAVLPDGWIDVTGISCDIGDPVIDGVVTPAPSIYHDYQGGVWVFNRASEFVEFRCDQVDSLKTQKFCQLMSYNGASWQVDTKSQELILYRSSYATASLVDPVNIPWSSIYTTWRDADNNDVTFNTALSYLLFAKAVSDHCSPVTSKCMEHKDALRAMLSGSPSYEDIGNYDITTGW